MNVLTLAIRNLFRNRRRSATTLLAVNIGLTAILVFGGYASSVIYGLQTAVIKRSGHLEIQRRGFFENGGDTPLAYGIADSRRLIDRLRQDPVLGPMLVIATPTLLFGGLAGNDAAGISRSVQVDGVVAEERNRMFDWNDYEVPNYVEPLALVGKPRDAAVLGVGLARKLQLCDPAVHGECRPLHAAVTATASTGADLPDDIAALSSLEAANAPKAEPNRIQVLAATARGAPNVASLRVVATTNVGVKEWDDVYLAMQLDEAQRLVYGDAAPQVTAIMIQLRHTAQLAAAHERLESLLRQEFPKADLEVLDYETLNPMYGQSVRFLLSIFTFMAVLIGTIVLFTVGNTMSTAVAERTVEVGTLRAIGLRRVGVRRLFVWEGAVLGVVGGIVGTASALLVGTAINLGGLTWTPPGYVHAYLIQIRILDDPPLLASTLAGLVVVTVFSAWWPARRAGRMGIVDALRHT
jgi:putative ABC transport system permease protein